MKVSIAIASALGLFLAAEARAWPLHGSDPTSVAPTLPGPAEAKALARHTPHPLARLSTAYRVAAQSAWVGNRERRVDAGSPENSETASAGARTTRRDDG